MAASGEYRNKWSVVKKIDKLGCRLTYASQRIALSNLPVPTMDKIISSAQETHNAPVQLLHSVHIYALT